jgi:serpin B
MLCLAAVGGAAMWWLGGCAASTASKTIVSTAGTGGAGGAGGSYGEGCGPVAYGGTPADSGVVIATGGAGGETDAGDAGDVAATLAVCGVPQGSAADAQGLATDDTAFALAFFPPAAAAVGAGSNVIVSPYSLSAMLMMLDVGAAGETDAQIESVLGLSANAATLAPAYAALTCGDEVDGDSTGNQLSIANSVWAQESIPFEPSFLSVLSSGYAAPVESVDFSASTVTSTINQWISTATQGQIPSFLQPGDVGPSTRFVLIDAVYFKGTWAQGFDLSETRLLPFTLSNGTTVQVPTMDGELAPRVGYSKTFTTIELPYTGNALAMDILVPNSLADLEASLTPDLLTAAIAQLGPSTATELQMPKFSFKTRLPLAPVLSGLGMPDAFDPAKADLAGIDGAEDLYVDLALQEATVEVDEEGTVAAAVTAGGGDCFNFVPEPLTISSPFLFLIRDIRSGSILFMGHVLDPRQGS